MKNFGLVSSVILATSLMMGGCSPKNKGGEEISLPGVGQLTVNPVSNKDFEKLLKTERRNVDNADAERALIKIGLDDGNTTGLSWDKRDGKNGHYAYKNLKAQTDDGQSLAIKELNLIGVRTENDRPTFDRLDISGLSLAGDKGTASVDRLSVSRPAPDTAQAIMEVLTHLDEIRDLKDLDLDIDFGDDVGFGAIWIEGLQSSDTKQALSVGKFGWGDDEKTDKGLLLLEDVVGGDDTGRSPVTFSLGRIAGSGLKTNLLDRMSGTSLPVGDAGFYARGFDSFEVKDVDFRLDNLAVDLDEIKAVSARKGDTVTVRQTLSPMKVRFVGQARNPQDTAYKALLDAGGADGLEISGETVTIMNQKTDTLTVRDTHFTLKDMFTLQYDYEGSGLNAAVKAAEAGASERDIMGDLNVQHMQFKITDHDGVDKMIRMIAEQTGTSPLLIKMQAKGGLMFLGSLAANQDQAEFLAEASNALSDFMDDGGTLTIAANPPAGVAVTDLQGRKGRHANPKALGLTITHQ